MSCHFFLISLFICEGHITSIQPITLICNNWKTIFVTNIVTNPRNTVIDCCVVVDHMVTRDNVPDTVFTIIQRTQQDRPAVCLALDTSGSMGVGIAYRPEVCDKT